LAKLALGDNDGALSDTTQVLRLNPNLAPAYSLRGTAYRRLANWREAIASFKQAANIYLAQKDKQNCQRCVDSITEIQVEQNYSKTVLAMQSDFFTRALQKVQQGNFREAMDDLNWLIQTDPKDDIAYSYRGMVLGKLGYYRDAIVDLNQALQLNPENAQAYCHRGMVRIEMGDYSGAINDCNQALELDPNYIDGYVERGNVHHKSGNQRLAIEDYSRVLKERPNDPQAYYRRAAARLDLEDVQGGVEDYQKAANIYFDRGDWANYRQALDHIKKLQTRPKRTAGKSSPKKEVFSQQKSATLTGLQNRLFKMVGGHRDIAERLVDIARYKYQGMPEEWYWQKAIEDLERERE